MGFAVLTPFRLFLPGVVILPWVSAGLAQDAPQGEMVTMEKVIVEATRPDPDSGLFHIHSNPWTYVSVAGYEILSRCDAEQTVAVARHVADSMALDSEFVPPEYLAEPATPMSFLMFNQAPSPAMEALIPSAFEFVRSADFGIYHTSFTMAAGGSDGADFDTHCAVQNRGGHRWLFAGGGLGKGPIPTGILFQLSRCRPALPSWYIYGMVGPCGLLRLADDGANVIVASATWVTESETESMLAQYKRKGVLPSIPPVEAFLKHAAGTNAPASQWPAPEYMAESALFLHWGLYEHPDTSANKQKARQARFMAFVERVRKEPLSEALLRECLGVGYADLQVQLSRYLVEAGREAVDTQLPKVASRASANLSSRPASRAEVARLVGDWERMEGDDLKGSSPALSQMYLKRAGITLRRCYGEGERNPLFLAVLGMYDFDVGATNEAREALLAATGAGVARQSAYIDLAEINFEEADLHPLGLNGSFSPEQTAGVLKPLFAARKLSRLEAAGYRIIAKAWRRASDKPSLRNLDALKEGVQFYPFDADLAYCAAQAYGQWGYASQCEEFIEQRLKFLDKASGRRLLDLKASLEKG